LYPLPLLDPSLRGNSSYFFHTQMLGVSCSGFLPPPRPPPLFRSIPPEPQPDCFWFHGFVSLVSGSSFWVPPQGQSPVELNRRRDFFPAVRPHPCALRTLYFKRADVSRFSKFLFPKVFLVVQDQPPLTFSLYYAHIFRSPV